MKTDRTRRIGRRTGCLVCSTCFAVTAFGQTNFIAGPVIAPALPDATVSLLRVAGAMAFVIGIFLGGVWLVKNWRRLTLQPGRGPKLQVLETRPLGGRHSLYVVGFEQQRFLISASPSGVTLLSHLPAAGENEPAGDAASGSKPAFAQTLAQVLKGK
ncbi:MAG TPA: flagellar biosynthetic protein FliO [Verrucomicrobiae bacterium]|nr:flagellar biosynthetic protein FliO [Verrucomicrobiae bacterium]